jgi:P27 family predicted phage terminase small subunit
MSGPSPTPTSILALRGSWRAKTRPAEPQPAQGRPACPKWLGTEARRVWKELLPHLEQMGLLSLADRLTLTRYCEAYATWTACRQFLHDHGTTYEVCNRWGKVIAIKAYPQVGMEQKLSKLLLDMEREYGLTPAARARLGHALTPQKSPKAARRPQAS